MAAIRALQKLASPAGSYKVGDPSERRGSWCEVVMEGRRFTVSSRPCNGRRIVAGKRRQSDEIVNIVQKLQRREIGSKHDRACMSRSQVRFRNFQLQEEFDSYDPNWHCFIPFLRRRSEIVGIVVSQDIVFALAQSGVCAAFSRETNRRICFLNASPDEVIRSLFYNKNNESLITVSVHAPDNFSSLRCRSTRIEYIRRGRLDAGFALFESESLIYPGYVEFDDVNGKVLTYSAQDSIYKVFDLKSYTLLYFISDKDVQGIKISSGIMLLIFTRKDVYVPFKILSIEDGTVLKSFKHLLHRNKKVTFIEQINEKLIVKQENENLQILDVRTSQLTEVCQTEFMTPSAFIFLSENQLFLTFQNRRMAVWNYRGDHLLWHPDYNINNIYITSDQDLIISYCKAASDDSSAESTDVPVLGSNVLIGLFFTSDLNFTWENAIQVHLIGLNSETITQESEATVFSRIWGFDGGKVGIGSDYDSFSRVKVAMKSAGSINISNILTGKCLAKIQASNSGKHTLPSRFQNTITEALSDITALYFDEDRNEIYTGNKWGLIHVWSN